MMAAGGKLGNVAGKLGKTLGKMGRDAEKLGNAVGKLGMAIRKMGTGAFALGSAARKMGTGFRKLGADSDALGTMLRNWGSRLEKIGWGEATDEPAREDARPTKKSNWGIKILRSGRLLFARWLSRRLPTVPRMLMKCEQEFSKNDGGRQEGVLIFCYGFETVVTDLIQRFASSTKFFSSCRPTFWLCSG
jgi:hypothetical protein